MKKVIFFLQLALVILGLMRPVSYIFSSSLLDRLGNSSGISPYPIVYTQINGVEQLFLEHQFVFHLMNGRIIERAAPRKLFSDPLMPHRLAVVYMIPAVLWNAVRQDIWQAPLRYGVCTPGAILHYFDIQEDVKRVKIFLKEKNPPDGREWVLTVNCSGN